MSKLVSVELNDFQIHEHLWIEFSPTVTVIVGRNDRGKSAALRAIRWVAFNRPLGESLIRWGQKGCSVVLTTERREVTRHKGSRNVYLLDTSEPFRAVGTEVPGEIKEALELDSINFQKQIDGPYWLTLSAPEVAREMNRIVDLSVIDRSMSNSGTNLRDANAQVKALTGLLTDAKVREGRLRWVLDVEAEARDALSCEQEAAAKRSEAQAIQRLVEAIEEAQEASQEIPDPSEVAPLIKRLNEIGMEVSSLNRKITQLEAEIEDQCVLSREIARLEKEADKMKPSLCPECKQPLP